MMFCELFVPRGAHGAEELRAVARRLTMKELLTHIDAIPEVAGAEEAATANPGVVDFLDSITHVVVHEIHTLDRGQPPARRGRSPLRRARVRSGPVAKGHERLSDRRDHPRAGHDGPRSAARARG